MATGQEEGIRPRNGTTLSHKGSSSGVRNLTFVTKPSPSPTSSNYNVFKIKPSESV